MHLVYLETSCRESAPIKMAVDPWPSNNKLGRRFPGRSSRQKLTLALDPQTFNLLLTSKSSVLSSSI